MTDRNPSPPPNLPETVDGNDDDPNPDKIGETVISKHWLFQTLLKLIKAVEGEEDTSSDDEENQKVVIELDKDLEDEMCNLWDMSADTDIANFLSEFKAREIFLGVISKTKSPRLLEIITGIMGNMVSNDNICKEFTEDGELITTVLDLTGSTDSPSLIQIVRMIHVCIVNEENGKVWMDALKSNRQGYMANLKNILENSLNGDLLKGVLQLMYYLLDKDSSFCDSERLVEPLVVAASQLHALKDYEALDEYWYILHLLTTQETSVKQIALHNQATARHLQAYIEYICNNEDIMPHVNRARAMAAALSVITSIVGSDIPFTGVEKIYAMYLTKLLEKVEAKLKREEETRAPVKESQRRTTETWEVLRDALLDLRTVIKVV